MFHGIYSIESPLQKERRTSIRRYQLLKILEEKGRENLTGLCSYFHMRKNSCSELLDRMIKDKLVQRTPSTEDRRKIYFHLTERGKQLITESENLFLERISALFKDLSDIELEEFIAALETIVGIARKLNLAPQRLGGQE